MFHTLTANYEINRRLRSLLGAKLRVISYSYIHNWSLQLFSQDYWPSFSHHLCFILIVYISGGTYSLKSIPKDRFFESLREFLIFYRFQTGTFIALIAINAIIEINISYKISIYYCSIKMEIVIILRKILNTAQA